MGHFSDRVLPVFVMLIEDCWSFRRDQRSSFKERHKVLRNIDFKITHNVDPREVRLYIDDVRQREKKREKLIIWFLGSFTKRIVFVQKLCIT
jgi:hypothetical protein